jgi:hypothetical protein
MLALMRPMQCFLPIQFKSNLSESKGCTNNDRESETNRFGSPIQSSRMVGKNSYSGAAYEGGWTKQFFMIQHIVWDSVSSAFKNMIATYQDFQRITYRERAIQHGDVLSNDFIAGAIVDQVGKKIILPDGRSIDGPTGDIYNVHGDVLVFRDPSAQSKKIQDKPC